MAFTSAITFYGARGKRKLRKGTYASSGGSTGGNIDTGLTVCEDMTLKPKGSSVGTNESVINETLPVAGNAVTIVTDANQEGYWEAEGY